MQKKKSSVLVTNGSVLVTNVINRLKSLDSNWAVLMFLEQTTLINLKIL